MGYFKIERERKNDIEEVVDQVSSEFKSWKFDPRHSVISEKKTQERAGSVESCDCLYQCQKRAKYG